MKKEKTIKQQKNSARRKQYLLFGSEFLSVIAPYGILMGVNSESWFVYNPEGWKIGLGGAIGMSLMMLATFLVSKKKENKELTSGFVSLIIGWYAVAGVFQLLSLIMQEIYIVMYYGGLGMITAFGLDVGSKHYKKIADDKKDSIIKAKKEIETEQAREEIVRIKVK